jgi:hypothetical protein
VDGQERVSLVQHQHKYPALAKSRKEQIRPLGFSPTRNLQMTHEKIETRD